MIIFTLFTIKALICSVSGSQENDMKWLLVGGMPLNSETSEVVTASESRLISESFGDKIEAGDNEAIVDSVSIKYFDDFILAGGYDMRTDTVLDKYLKYKPETGSWVQEGDMSPLPQPRFKAASAGMGENNHWTWVTGGLPSTLSRTTLNCGGYECQEAPALPVPLYGHCMVSGFSDDNNEVLIIGGYQGQMEENDGFASNVWLVDCSQGCSAGFNLNIALINGLKQARSDHGCSIWNDEEDGKMKVVVAGGFNGHEVLDSVEVLTINRGEPGGGFYGMWEKLPEIQQLPLPVQGGALLPLNWDFTEISLVGGFSRERKILNTIITLKKSKKWEIEATRLSRPRKDFAYFVLENSIPKKKIEDQEDDFY